MIKLTINSVLGKEVFFVLKEGPVTKLNICLTEVINFEVFCLYFSFINLSIERNYYAITDQRIYLERRIEVYVVKTSGRTS